MFKRNFSQDDLFEFGAYLVFIGTVMLLPVLTDDVFWLNRISKYLVFGFVSKVVELC